MAHLTSEQLEALEEELRSMLAKLDRSMRATGEASAPVELDQTTVGRLSRMDQLQNQGLARNLQEREQVRLAEIQRALTRIADGSYGRCTRCGADVPFGRLLVFPEAPTCAAC